MDRMRPIRPAELAVATILAALALALPAGTAAAALPAATSVVLDAPGSAAAVRDYWTAKRMRRAEPPPLPAPQGVPAAAPQGAGPPAHVPPAVAGAPASAPLLRGAADSEASASRAAVAIADPTAPGVRAHGKVFFTVDKGSDPGDYVCSGTAVNSRNRSLVWTAGHCVYDVLDAGGKSVNFAFVPAYDHGAMPYGIWPARKLGTTKRWRRDGDLRFDLGAAIVRRRGGRKLQSVVGARGIGFDQPRHQSYSIFGYPALEPFDGEAEYRCDSGLVGGDLGGGGGPRTVGTSCDMTPGSSGGGWIAGRTLLSVTSYSRPSRPNVLYGPYLSRTAKRLYKRMRGHRRSSRHGGRR